MVNLAIFVSGNGTNCENLIKYFKDSKDVQVVLVLSNKSDAYALTRAKNLSIPTEVMPKSSFSDEQTLMGKMSEYKVDFIVLAGFLLLIPKFLIEAYPRKIINLHPALLPKFGGKGMYGHFVHEAVYEAGEKETGMTVHYVSEERDGGEIIDQYKVPLDPSDTPIEIAKKEHELEMKYFPKVVDNVIKSTDFAAETN